jgi:hypothetical protein
MAPQVAVVSPIPSAGVVAATVVKPGSRADHQRGANPELTGFHLDLPAYATTRASRFRSRALASAWPNAWSADAMTAPTTGSPASVSR